MFAGLSAFSQPRAGKSWDLEVISSIRCCAARFSLQSSCLGKRSWALRGRNLTRNTQAEGCADGASNPWRHRRRGLFLPVPSDTRVNAFQKSRGEAEPIINNEHPLNLVFSLAVISITSSAEFDLQKIAGWRLRSWAWFRGPTSGARFRYPPSIRANRRSGQTPSYLMRRRTRVRSQPGWPEQTHLIHGSLAGTPGGMFGRSFQP
jgi:hypothetical protein